jgi:hypothetical protein
MTAEEQALIVKIPLQSGDFGDTEERQHIATLEEQLIAAIKESGSGEFDGNEFGNGVCTLYLYGGSAEQLYTVAQPILNNFQLPPGSHVIRRYGKPGSKQDRLALGEHEASPG